MAYTSGSERTTCFIRAKLAATCAALLLIGSGCDKPQSAVQTIKFENKRSTGIKVDISAHGEYVDGYYASYVVEALTTKVIKHGWQCLGDSFGGSNINWSFDLEMTSVEGNPNAKRLGSSGVSSCRSNAATVVCDDTDCRVAEGSLPSR